MPGPGVGEQAAAAAEDTVDAPCNAAAKQAWRNEARQGGTSDSAHSAALQNNHPEAKVLLNGSPPPSPPGETVLHLPGHRRPRNWNPDRGLGAASLFIRKFT